MSKHKFAVIDDRELTEETVFFASIREAIDEYIGEYGYYTNGKWIPFELHEASEFLHREVHIAQMDDQANTTILPKIYTVKEMLQNIVKVIVIYAPAESYVDYSLEQASAKSDTINEAINLIYDKVINVASPEIAQLFTRVRSVQKYGTIYSFSEVKSDFLANKLDTLPIIKYAIWAHKSGEDVDVDKRLGEMNKTVRLIQAVNLPAPYKIKVESTWDTGTIYLRK